MKIPMLPPPFRDLLESVISKDSGRRYLRLLGERSGPAPNGKYLHWDKVFHVPPPDDLSSEEWWLSIKLARHHLYQLLPLKDRQGQPFRYALFDGTHRSLHQIDRDASGSFRSTSHQQVTNPSTRDMYLLKSLFEEAITSSQLEGATTTRQVAKEMLRIGRKPRDRSEQMIYNNYLAMQFIRDVGDRPLTTDIILRLQEILTQNTLDDPTGAGRFRRSDESILVVDEVGNLLHEPPSARELPSRVDAICTFANGVDQTQFLHPVVKAILLHFQLAYDHPFVDGNGRTARALFYWSMKASGYWLCEFISISRILKKAPAAYARSFLYTETDENDATYFIDAQLRVILHAINELHEYLDRKAKELHETETLLQQSYYLRKQFNHRQLALINHALKRPYFVYTIESHRGSHHISYETARTDLMILSDLGFLDKSSVGRAFRFASPSNLRERIAAFKEA